ncbi:hypothetical protein G6F66_003074 [Rhizopus arrhizus]|nr:hypothetical protein G6F66_003074 [Rhizopus arrhizus]
MSAVESNGFSLISDSYYENFLESLAQIVSKLLTDQETEAVLTSIRSFQEKLRRLSRPAILKQMAGSSFISAYKGVLCAMRHFRKSHDKDSDKLNAFVAGCVAGLALAFDRDRRRRQSVMLYLLTRAIQFNGAWFMKQWSLRRKEKHPGEVKWDDHLAKFLEKYSGVAVMMIANAQLIYAFLFNHDTLPNSFYAFLLTHGGFKKNFGRMAGPVTEMVGLTVNQSLEDHSPITIPEGVSTRNFYFQNMSPNIGSLIPSKLHHKYILCIVQHPFHESCTGDKLGLFMDELLRSAKLYVPLNIIMLIVFRSKQFMLDPKHVGQKFILSCFRSCLFLTMYVVIGLATPCWLRRLFNREAPWFYAATGAVAGSMIIIEAPARHLELALYCLPRAMESLWKTGIKNGWVKNVPHGDILLFMASMGSLMTLYQNDKDTISSHYLGVMTRFFGQN